MNKQSVIFEHEEHKLTLNVFDTINEYKQHVFIAQLKLYTLDGLLLVGENYIFPTLATKVKNNIDLAFDYYLDHLQGRFLPSTLAHDLYLKHLREKGDNNEQ